MCTLKKYLDDYKNATLKLIDILKCDNIDAIDEFINERQDILDSIKKLEYTKNEINSICNEFQLFALDKKLNDLIIIKKNNLKDEMGKVSIIKNAQSNYTYNQFKKPMIFSKKV